MMSIAVVFAFLSLCAFCTILVSVNRSEAKKLKYYREYGDQQYSEVAKLITEKEKLYLELNALQNKFKDNPSYECQQLLADLLRGHALFHIERLSPENVLLRRG